MSNFVLSQPLKKIGVQYVIGSTILFTIVGCLLGAVVSASGADALMFILPGLCAGISVRFATNKAYALATGGKWSATGSRWSVVWRALVVLFVMRVITVVFASANLTSAEDLVMLIVVFLVGSALGCYLGFRLGHTQSLVQPEAATS